uniref:Putative attacin n=1 Tax=Corethrella appendiculata TaxID=1370023 RepID=U5ENE9_9DIPT
MFLKNSFLILIIVIIFGLINYSEEKVYVLQNSEKFLVDNVKNFNQNIQRKKRQFNINIEANHEEGYGTDFKAEAIASIWKSKNGNTRIDGHATYSKHFGGYSGNGKSKFGGMITFSHNWS